MRTQDRAPHTTSLARYGGIPSRIVTTALAKIATACQRNDVSQNRASHGACAGRRGRFRGIFGAVLQNCLGNGYLWRASGVEDRLELADITWAEGDEHVRVLVPDHLQLGALRHQLLCHLLQIHFLAVAAPASVLIPNTSNLVLPPTPDIADGSCRLRQYTTVLRSRQTVAHGSTQHRTWNPQPMPVPDNACAACLQVLDIAIGMGRTRPARE